MGSKPFIIIIINCFEGKRQTGKVLLLLLLFLFYKKSEADITLITKVRVGS